MAEVSVAVITRTRNRPVLLRRALDSVLGQDFDDWRHVIVNDGGDPAPVDRLVEARSADYAGRALVIHNDASRGMEAASNQGLRACGSRFIAIHDDDDSWHPDFLRKTVAFMEQEPPPPNLGGVVTYSEWVLEAIRNDDPIIIDRAPYGSPFESVLLFDMLGENLFPPIAFVFRRAAMEAVGMFREDLPVLGDWEFNVRFLQKFEIGVIREYLASYHHRQPTEPLQYANSVVGDVDKHGRYDALIRNEWLRDDLEKGVVGIGTLAGLSRHARTQERRLSTEPPEREPLLTRMLPRFLRG